MFPSSRRLGASLLALLGLSLSHAVGAEPCDPAQRIVLLEASDEGVLDVALPPGEAAVALHFHVHGPRAGQTGRFVVSSLSTSGGLAARAGAGIRDRSDGAGSAAACPGEAPGHEECVEVELDREWLPLELALRDLEADREYSAMLHFVSGRSRRAWPVRVRTGQPGVVAVDSLPAIALTNHPLRPFERMLGGCPWRDAAEPGTSCVESREPQFMVTLSDATGTGPYRVRAHLATPATEAASETSTTVAPSALSFWRCAPSGPGDTASSECPQQMLSLFSPQDDLPGLEIERGGQAALWVHAAELGPGEYRGLLRFAPVGSLVDDERGRLDLSLQVRDHWLFAVLLMIVGAFLGWLSRVYLPGRMERRSVLAEIAALRQRVLALAENGVTSRRRLPTEAGSFAYARVKALIAQARSLASLVPRFILMRTEIRGCLAQAKLRLETLERIREARTELQARADGWWAAHWTLHRELRELLELAAAAHFDATCVQRIDARLAELRRVWLDQAFPKTIRASLEDRDRTFLRDLATGGPLPDDAAGTVRGLQRDLEGLRGLEVLSEGDLSRKDEILARLGYVWRHRKRSWLDQALLAKVAADPLEKLYELADRMLWLDWKAVAADANTLPNRIQLSPAHSGHVETFEFVEFELALGEEFESLIAMHPARICWTFSHCWRDSSLQTDRTRAMQFFAFFPGWGRVSAEAKLIWQGAEIVVGRKPDAVRVRPNRINRGVVVTEIVVVALATGFAVVTGLATNYGPTFGTFKQYVALFLWAAGVSVGGNVLRQGTTADGSPPGNQGGA